ncbi:hypothetical protein J6590_055731 [Homalodisca vitripennis]|nr:hypothetical protein J6590_055731 [Homalodisca vitripennis]
MNPVPHDHGFPHSNGKCRFRKGVSNRSVFTAPTLLSDPVALIALSNREIHKDSSAVPQGVIWALDLRPRVTEDIVREETAERDEKLKLSQ